MLRLQHQREPQRNGMPQQKRSCNPPNGRAQTTLCSTSRCVFAHLSGAHRRAAVQACVIPPHVIHEAFDDVQHLASLREQENPMALQCSGPVRFEGSMRLNFTRTGYCWT